MARLALYNLVSFCFRGASMCFRGMFVFSTEVIQFSLLKSCLRTQAFSVHFEFALIPFALIPYRLHCLLPWACEKGIILFPARNKTIQTLNVKHFFQPEISIHRVPMIHSWKHLEAKIAVLLS